PGGPEEVAGGDREGDRRGPREGPARLPVRRPRGPDQEVVAASRGAGVPPAIAEGQPRSEIPHHDQRVHQPAPASPAEVGQAMTLRRLYLASFLLLAPTFARAEEIYFQDGKRLMAMVEAVGADGKMTLRLPNGRMQTADL